ncbi:hypothetical protein BDZ85DRAFT_285560 [Elsinoe ampelina]|uniref:Rhodopsin domain-containing protein n=1 Tax=Elsinoe ampelina TaxID=302913 RepID=A0A6A6G178_9PEZI|nr:hypothetical protein BDZ85DRAFT_285560 [Elsinoe ampelina]
MSSLQSLLLTLPLLPPLLITLLTLVLLLTLHRLYLRLRATRPFRREITHLLTLTLFTISTSLLLLLASTLRSYLAINSPVLTTTQTTSLLRWSVVSYALSSSTGKIALLSPLPKAAHALIKPVINSLLALHAVATVVFLGLTLFPCGATLAVSLTATCDAGRLSGYADMVWSGLNAVVGVAGLLVAISDLVQVEVEGRVKLFAVVPVGLGAVAVGASMVRVVVVGLPVAGGDGMGRGVMLGLVAAVEIGLGLVAGCLSVCEKVVEGWFAPRERDVFDQAEHGKVEVLESRPVTRRGRDQAREARRDGRAREVEVKGAREAKKGEIKAWSDAVGRERKRNGVYVAAVELDEGMSPMGSPEVVQSIWKS